MDTQGLIFYQYFVYLDILHRFVAFIRGNWIVLDLFEQEM